MIPTVTIAVPLQRRLGKLKLLVGDWSLSELLGAFQLGAALGF